MVRFALVKFQWFVKARDMYAPAHSLSSNMRVSLDACKPSTSSDVLSMHTRNIKYNVWHSLFYEWIVVVNNSIDAIMLNIIDAPALRVAVKSDTRCYESLGFHPLVSDAVYYRRRSATSVWPNTVRTFRAKSGLKNRNMTRFTYCWVI